MNLLFEVRNDSLFRALFMPEVLKLARTRNSLSICNSKSITISGSMRIEHMNGMLNGWAAEDYSVEEASANVKIPDTDGRLNEIPSTINLIRAGKNNSLSLEIPELFKILKYNENTVRKFMVSKMNMGIIPTDCKIHMSYGEDGTVIKDNFFFTCRGEKFYSSMNTIIDYMQKKHKSNFDNFSVKKIHFLKLRSILIELA